MSKLEEKIADALYYLNYEYGVPKLRYSDYLTRARRIVQHTGLQDEISNLQQNNKKLREALVEITKLGSVCDEFELCHHPACRDSAAACLVALDILSKIKKEK